MPENPLESPNLDIALLTALQFAEQAALEPMQLIAVAERLNLARRHADVVRLYQTWLGHCSSSADYIVQFNLGVTLSQLEQLPAAEQAYRAAILRKPDFSQAWFNLGAVIERQGRPDNALVIWQSMLDHPLVGPELLGQRGADGGGLDGRRSVIALLAHGLQDGRGQVQFVKCHVFGCARPGRWVSACRATGVAEPVSSR